MMLFAMLVAVLLLMKEAGKPERWKWMGFDEVAVNPSSEKPQASQARPESLESFAFIESDPVQSLAHSNLPDSEPAIPTGRTPVNGSANYPVAAEKFWANSFEKMNATQRRNLFRFIKSIRTDRAIDESFRTVFEQLTEWLDNRRAEFHREMFDHLALIPDGTEEKTRLANELFESQEIWEKKILPTFQSVLHGEDFTVSQLQQINHLQQVLDPLAFKFVQDGTTIGWEGDSTAWIRLWERVNNSELGEPTDATHLQLSGQPEYYRGRAVSIGGWVRAARRENLTDSELGIDHYFILWVRPADTNLSPYCLYSQGLPESFPELTDQFRDVNERIDITGAFFKIRTYVDAAGEVGECPVVLAKNFTMNPELMPLSVNAWQPSRATLVTILILIPLVATAIAWLVYWGTQSRQYQPGQVANKRIQSTLQELTQDPRVQTDMEKIRELYQADAEEN